MGIRGLPRAASAAALALALLVAPLLAAPACSETFGFPPILAPVWGYAAKGWTVDWVSWSPKGMLAAQLHNGRLQGRIIVFKPGGGIAWDSGATYPLIGPPRWDPRGGKLAVVAVKNGVRYILLVDVEHNTTRLVRPKGVRGDIWGFRWSPRGGGVAALNTEQGLVVANLSSGEVLWRLPITPIATLEWSPDGGILVIATPTGLTALDPGGHKLWSYKTPAMPRRLSWSPDGRLLAVGLPGVDHLLGRIVVLGRDGKELWSASDPLKAIEGFSWGANDTMLVITPKYMKLYNSKGRIVILSPSPTRSSVAFPVSVLWRPGSVSFLIYQEAMGLLLLNPEGLATLWRDEPGAPMRASWSPDGASLAVVLDWSKVLVYREPPPGWLATVRVKADSGWWVNPVVQTWDGLVRKEHEAVTGFTTSIYATPGSYVVSYWARRPPKGWLIIGGDPSRILQSNAVKVNLTLKPGSRVVLEVSSGRFLANLNKSLARIIVEAPPQATVIFKKLDENVPVESGVPMMGAGERRVYAKPGEYKVQLRVGATTYDAGTIRVHAGEILRLNLNTLIHTQTPRTTTTTSGAHTGTHTTAETTTTTTSTAATTTAGSPGGTPGSQPGTTTGSPTGSSGTAATKTKTGAGRGLGLAAAAAVVVILVALAALAARRR